MKKILFILFIGGPVLGFLKTTMFSEAARPLQDVFKNSTQVAILTVPAEGIKSAVKRKAWIAYRTGKDRNIVLVDLSSGGFVEKKEVLAREKFLDCQVIWMEQGSQALKMIQLTDGALKKYPFKGEPEAMLGPNVNTLTASLIKQLAIPAELPSNAMGSYYMGEGFHWNYQSTGNQLALAFGGYCALFYSDHRAGFSLLGLTLSYDWKDQVIGLPGLGDLRLKS